MRRSSRKRAIINPIHAIVTLLLLATLTLPASPTTASHQATPNATTDLTSLGLPTLDVTITLDAFVGLPETLPAGRYLINLTVEDDIPFGGAVAFVKANGITSAELIDILKNTFGEDDAEATSSPVADHTDHDATPEADSAGFPPEILAATAAGGAFAGAGQTAQAIVDLAPGEWIAWPDDPEASQPPVIITVTGDLPTNLPEPPSTATITMAEYTIQVTEGTLHAGQQLVKVTNVGAQPHFLILASAPAGTTKADLDTAIQEEITAFESGQEPTYSGLDPNTDLVDSGYTPTQSIGTTTWHLIDLTASPLILICFFPDYADGIPHAYHGMYELVDIPA